jgi:hypothetical protein
VIEDHRQVPWLTLVTLLLDGPVEQPGMASSESALGRGRNPQGDAYLTGRGEVGEAVEARRVVSDGSHPLECSIEEGRGARGRVDGV